MVRVADYVAQRLAAHGVRHVFLVTGGGAMHLNDAFGRVKGMEYVCCHHEQACAIAAESYYRSSNRLAAVNVTTGPGGTNALTGVYGAYVDSMAMIVVSGQVKYETVVRSTDLPLRQLGDQEVDIVRLAAPVTKYAVMVTEPQDVRYHLERALHLATHGRPGPVWLDIPMNVQGAQVDPERLRPYDPAEDRLALETSDVKAAARAILKKLAIARRPVLYAGTGIRLANAHPEFLKLVDALKVPVVTAWNNHDLLWDEHPAYVGRPGTVGDRAGNFAVQSSDLLLVLGSRLNIRLVSYNWKAFAPHAYKVMVDVDPAELKKPTLSIDLPINADLGEVLRALLAEGPRAEPAHAAWLEWCQERRRRYPVVQPEYWNSPAVNPYCFMDALFRELPEGQLVVTGDGTACVTSFQAAFLRRGQRLYTNSGCASMGYDVPAAIGACFAHDRAPVVCIAGDGSLQMNVQELQTIATHRLPIKLFILNNQGYHSIRQTQRNYFPDNVVGCGVESGLGFPDFEKLAHAYGLPFTRLATHAELKDRIGRTLAGPGPQVCEVVLDLAQDFAPKLASRRLPDGTMVSPPLDDLAPFLPREELELNRLPPDPEVARRLRAP